MTGLPCPNCGSELALLEQYHRQYCYACGHYAPEGYGDRGAKICPSCGGILSFVTQYDRYFCYRDNAYPPEDTVLRSLQDVVPRTPPANVAPSATYQDSTVVVLEPARVAEPKVTAVEVSAEPDPQSEEGVEEEIPSEESPVREKRPLDRYEISQAKKPLLMDLCKAYDLDPTGNKEQLRERLLSYLDELEAEAQPVDVPTPAEARTEPAPAEAAPADDVETTTPIVEEPPSIPEELPSEPTTPTPFVQADRAVVETRPAPQPAVEVASAPAIVTASEPQSSVTEVPATPSLRLEHPCPTCGRELAYVSQYNRWYCYDCRAYAPAAKSRFACPNCGATLRWIEQYERWWCDSCRRYAPADLPKPERAIAAAAAPTAAIERTVQISAPAVMTFAHRHRNPGSGIGLVGFGVVLFVVYEILVDLPAVLTFNVGVVLTPDVAFGLRFFAFVFVAIGAILGLAAVRDRR